MKGGSRRWVNDDDGVYEEERWVASVGCDLVEKHWRVARSWARAHPVLIGTSHKGFVKPKRNIIFQNMFSSEFDILIKLMKLTLTQHTDCVTTPCVFVWNTHFVMLNLIIEEMLTGHLTLAACQLHPIWAPELRLRALTHPLQATNYNREFCLVVFVMYMWIGGVGGILKQITERRIKFIKL